MRAGGQVDNLQALLCRQNVYRSCCERCQCDLQVDVFFLYYPKRLGQVLMLDAPWGFQPGWEVVKPWLKKYAALVRFVSREELRKEFFTPETCPEEFLK